MPKFLQPSLSGGELAPGLRGRVDMARYAISAAKCRNIITKPTGGAAKRPGTRFRGYVKYSNKLTRLIAFIYSTQTKYLVEMGDQYLRFWVDGALVTNSTKAVTGITQANPAVVTAAAHGFSNGDQVILTGLLGPMARLNNRSYTVAGATTNTFQLSGLNSTGFGAYTSGGSVSRIVEVDTPYTEAMIRAVRYTQSADVMYLVHGSVPPKELRRLTANSFQLVDFAFKRGPFRSFNADEAAVMYASGTIGNITLTSTVDTFTADDVGGLFYIEEKELRGIKPWASAEKNPPLNTLRRSDSKVYQAVSVPTVSPPNYYVTGGVRPIHESGRAFDGPQDVKSDGVNSYTVGVEWQFLHNTFGILMITGFTSAKVVSATVIERLPDSVKGAAPAPGSTWTFSGNGVLKQFNVTGAVSYSMLDYQVTIDGLPVQSNPFYSGGGGVGGGGGGNPRPGKEPGVTPNA